MEYGLAQLQILQHATTVQGKQQGKLTRLLTVV